MKISGGIEEEGIVVGNAYDKYGSRNPLVRYLMSGFEAALDELFALAKPETVHEAGCGEGFHTLKWRAEGVPAVGSDFSSQVIELARANARARGLPETMFGVHSVYDLDKERDGADLLVCCEVLEHLEDPAAALRALRAVAGRHVILSVPREPLWRVMNMCRGKYLGDFGNTPGHVQHWSRTGFLQLLSNYLNVLEVRSPVPWTMALCSV